MAQQRVDHLCNPRLGENAHISQKAGKAMIPGHRTSRARSAFAQLGQQPAVIKLASDKPLNLDGHHPQVGDVTERNRANDEGRSRAYTLETTESNLEKLKGKPVQFSEVSDIDTEDVDKEFACAEYAKHISHYLKFRESLYQVQPNYIQSHVHINERMRAILVDWLVQVHDKFRLLQETLFLTISLLDRYLATETAVQKSNLQLVGVTAMLLASKIEEIYSPEIRDFVYITDNAYTPDEIRASESRMAMMLQFDFGDPLCISFLRRNSKAAKADAEKHILAKYFMELMLPDYECLLFPPSIRAAAALCLAMKITDNSPWNTTMVKYSLHDEKELVSCMRKMSQLVLKSKKRFKTSLRQ